MLAADIIPLGRPSKRGSSQPGVQCPGHVVGHRSLQDAPRSSCSAVKAVLAAPQLKRLDLGGQAGGGAVATTT